MSHYDEGSYPGAVDVAAAVAEAVAVKQHVVASVMVKILLILTSPLEAEADEIPMESS